ncbi:MAG: leucine-rich repeat protein [Prevotellaceae bacterium]|nr:leucine-rich repeat protein [Prevotellaceae bacterium]
MKKYLLIKRSLTFMLCAFAALSANAYDKSTDGKTLTIYQSDLQGGTAFVNGGGSVFNGVETVKLSGTFTSWTGGPLGSGGSATDKQSVTEIDLSGADFSAFTGTNSWNFSNFMNLKTFTWPTAGHITVIPSYALKDCGIETIHIPGYITSIKSQAFDESSDQKSLKTIIFDEYGHEEPVLDDEGNPKYDDEGNPVVKFVSDVNMNVERQAFSNNYGITDVYINTVGKITSENNAFPYAITYGHTDGNRDLAILHFPESKSDFYTNLKHMLTTETAADQGLLQKWLQDHATQAQTDANEGNNGWWEFVETGGTTPDDPELGDKFLMTYSHPTLSHIVPDGVKAYIVHSIAKNNTYGLWEVTLKSIGVIPPRTGVILYGETNSKNDEGKPTLAMTIVRMAVKISDGQNATLYPDGAKLPDGTTVDLSLRRDNWSGLEKFKLGDYKNYLEPTANEEGTPSILNPFETDESGKVAFRNFGFGHFYKTKIKNTSFDDYAGFFRCSKNSKISSGKAYLRLAANEFLTGDEMELLIKKDDGYYLRAVAKNNATDVTEYVDERETQYGGYWSIATWDPEEDFGIRDVNIPTSKFIGEPVFEEDETNGVAKILIPVEAEEEVYYNLNGQRVTNPTHGIFIKNGKKVIIK